MRNQLTFLFIVLLFLNSIAQRRTERHRLINPVIGYTGFKSHYLDVGLVRNWKTDTLPAFWRFELLAGATMDQTRLATTTVKVHIVNPWFHIMDIGMFSKLYTDFANTNFSFGPEIGVGYGIRFCYSYQFMAKKIYEPQISPHCFSLYLSFLSKKKR